MSGNILSADLNADLGESFGAYTIGADPELIPLITSANIACGFHAGDPLVMRKTVELCARHGVAVGAHPGFPDLAGFGRRNLAMKPEEARAAVLYQAGALAAFCRAAGVPLRHVKLHGAMYNMAAKDPVLARAVAEAVAELGEGTALMGLSGSEMLKAAREAGIPVLSEVFADRGYRSDGSLVPRGQPGDLIQDEAEAAARAERMVREGLVRSVDGTDAPVRADSICVHGDGPKALLFAGRIRRELEKAGIRVMRKDTAGG